MLVIPYHLPQSVVVVMVVARLIALHTLHRLLLQKRHTVHHPQDGALRFHGLQDGIHPGVGLAAQVQEEIARLHRQDIRGSRLIGVALSPRRQQQLHIRQLSPGGAGKVVGREHRGHHMQPAVVALRRPGAAGQKPQRQQRAEAAPESFHRAVSLN